MVEHAKGHCTTHGVRVIMGDMNAKVGGERQSSVLGPFVLGERKNRGVQWIDWCEFKIIHGFSNHLEYYEHGKALEKDIKIKLITSLLQ